MFLDLMAMPREMLGQFIDWQHGLMRAPDPNARVAAARAIYGSSTSRSGSQTPPTITCRLRGIDQDSGSGSLTCRGSSLLQPSACRRSS